MKPTNIFADLPSALPAELFETLLQHNDLKLERIISTGQATPPGTWYDQETHEWVILLRGRAGLRFEGETAVREMAAGDYLHIPAHQRHRVEWTAPREATVWLALHYSED